MENGTIVTFSTFFSRRVPKRETSGLPLRKVLLHQLHLMAIFIITLIVLGCATAPPYNPFKLDENEFYSKVKIIALAPIIVPADLENPEQVKAQFESLSEAKLHEAGFSTIPPDEYATI